MQQVPNPGCANSSSSTTTAPSAAASTPTQEPRWNRVPRVQPLRNQNDQRVPFYVDQTVPVWPLGENARVVSAGGLSRPSRDQVNLRNTHTNHGATTAQNLKGARKWGDVNDPADQCGTLRTVRPVRIRPESHAFSVNEILQCSSITSLKWSGIEQDLFTCTAFVSKDFFIPFVADFIVNKKSKLTTGGILFPTFSPQKTKMDFPVTRQAKMAKMGGLTSLTGL